MTWNARLCGECRERFMPARLDQQLCGACAAKSDELQKLLTYLRVHPEDPVTRVSVATGVTEQTITRLAQDGLLPVVPRGAEPKRTLRVRREGALPRLQGRGGEAGRARGGPARGHAAPRTRQLDAALQGMRSRRPGSR